MLSASLALTLALTLAHGRPHFSPPLPPISFSNTRLRSLVQWQARAPEEAAEESAGESAEAGEAPKAKGGKKEKRENFFNQFGFSGPSKYYEGGFEDEMTRAEASLILGVRESASAKRIKDAHRTILIANHPDTGGSNFIAVSPPTKIYALGKRAFRAGHSLQRHPKCKF